MNTRQKNGEVPDIDGIFLLIMNFELRLGDSWPNELRPGPMMLLSHEIQQFQTKLR